MLRCTSFQTPFPAACRFTMPSSKVSGRCGILKRLPRYARYSTCPRRSSHVIFSSARYESAWRSSSIHNELIWSFLITGIHSLARWSKHSSDSPKGIRCRRGKQEVRQTIMGTVPNILGKLRYQCQPNFLFLTRPPPKSEKMLLRLSCQTQSQDIKLTVIIACRD